MAYSQIPTRTGADTNSSADINQLQDNLDAIKGGVAATAPTFGLEDSGYGGIARQGIFNPVFTVNTKGIIPGGGGPVAASDGTEQIDSWTTVLSGVTATVEIAGASAPSNIANQLDFIATSTASGKIGILQIFGGENWAGYFAGKEATWSAYVTSDNANARITLWDFDSDVQIATSAHTGGGGTERLSITATPSVGDIGVYIWIASSTGGSASISSTDVINVSGINVSEGSSTLPNVHLDSPLEYVRSKGNPVIISDLDDSPTDNADKALASKYIYDNLVPVVSAPAGNLTITDSDRITHVLPTATGTITLPTLADNYGRTITVKRDFAGTSTPVIIDGEGGETIDGETTLNLYGLGSGYTIFASQDAGEWVIISTISGQWESYTPSLGASGSMTYTGTSVAVAKWIQIGSKIDVFSQFSGTLGGTAAALITMTLPVNVNDIYTIPMGSGWATNSSTFSTINSWNDGASQAYIRPYNGANWTLAVATVRVNYSYII